ATIYVRRTERGRAAIQADRLRDALAEGAPVTLFAEGSTGDGRGIRPFRASLLAALAPPPPGVMLQPVVLDYGAEAPLVAWPDELDAGQDAMRILALSGRRKVTLRFLAAIEPAATPDRKLLAAKARAAMCEALGGSASEPV
ncbi:MAG TPA: 1-acyl-sn-glycerol-3-phosphate acyltransferase, partial [Sphingomonas sp.]|nr:1-acyl-sn-glycerol-3-phosphate acyltransferase [Sphingomonas sp.]